MPGGPQVYYADATADSLRHAWWTPTGWQFETLDGRGSTMAGHTSRPRRRGGGGNAVLKTGSARSAPARAGDKWAGNAEATVRSE